MFPLYTKDFPASADELGSILNASIRRVFSMSTDPVAIQATAYPALHVVRIILDRAQLRPNPPPPPRPIGQSSPALTVNELEITAAGLSLGPATADLNLRAREVQLHRGADVNGEIILVVHRAGEGAVEVSTDIATLERAIATLANTEAGKHGVSIDQVELRVTSRGVRSIDAEVRLRGRKLFFTTVLRVTAKLDLDEQLNAKLSGMACHGEGAIGALACNVLAPHLQKLDGRSFALMALPLGEIRLRDVRLSVNDRLRVNAEFGV